MFSLLQRKIAKRLCPEVFDDIVYYKAYSRKWELNFYKLESEIQSYRKINAGMKKIIEREKQDVCKLAFDKDQNPVIIAISNYKNSYLGDEVIMLRVLCPTSDRRHELLINASIHYNDSKLFIEDIQGGYDKGYGTAAMQEIIHIAKQKNLQKIAGKLTNGDLKDHKERLIHFYKKFGFSVTITIEENDTLGGKIVLELLDHKINMEGQNVQSVL